MQLTELTNNNEEAILTRVIQPGHGDMPPSAARALLKLNFTPDDRQRMHELVVKNQSGDLAENEQHELDSYLRVGRFLDLLAAKARLSLKKRG